MKIQLTKIFGTSLVLAALPLASGQTATAPAKPAARVAAPKAAAKPAPSGLVAFKDPVTGEIRQPEASEIGDLLNSNSQSATATVGGGIEVFRGVGNTVGVRLDDSFMSSVVMTKGPDGKLTMECVESSKNAPVVTATKPAAKKVVLDEK